MHSRFTLTFVYVCRYSRSWILLSLAHGPHFPLRLRFPHLDICTYIHCLPRRFGIIASFFFVFVHRISPRIARRLFCGSRLPRTLWFTAFVSAFLASGSASLAHDLSPRFLAVVRGSRTRTCLLRTPSSGSPLSFCTCTSLHRFAVFSAGFSRFARVRSLPSFPRLHRFVLTHSASLDRWSFVVVVRPRTLLVRFVHSSIFLLVCVRSFVHAFTFYVYPRFHRLPLTSFHVSSYVHVASSPRLVIFTPPHVWEPSHTVLVHTLPRFLFVPHTFFTRLISRLIDVTFLTFAILILLHVSHRFTPHVSHVRWILLLPRHVSHVWISHLHLVVSFRSFSRSSAVLADLAFLTFSLHSFTSSRTFGSLGGTHSRFVLHVAITTFLHTFHFHSFSFRLRSSFARYAICLTPLYVFVGSSLLLHCVSAHSRTAAFAFSFLCVYLTRGFFWNLFHSFPRFHFHVFCVFSPFVRFFFFLSFVRLRSRLGHPHCFLVIFCVPAFLVTRFLSRSRCRTLKLVRFVFRSLRSRSFVFVHSSFLVRSVSFSSGTLSPLHVASVHLSLHSRFAHLVLSAFARSFVFSFAFTPFTSSCTFPAPLSCHLSHCTSLLTSGRSFHAFTCVHVLCTRIFLFSCTPHLSFCLVPHLVFLRSRYCTSLHVPLLSHTTSRLHSAVPRSSRVCVSFSYTLCVSFVYLVCARSALFFPRPISPLHSGSSLGSHILFCVSACTVAPLRTLHFARLSPRSLVYTLLVLHAPLLVLSRFLRIVTSGCTSFWIYLVRFLCCTVPLTSFGFTLPTLRFARSLCITFSFLTGYTFTVFTFRFVSRFLTFDFLVYLDPLRSHVTSHVFHSHTPFTLPRLPGLRFLVSPLSFTFYVYVSHVHCVHASSFPLTATLHSHTFASLGSHRCGSPLFVSAYIRFALRSAFLTSCARLRTDRSSLTHSRIHIHYVLRTVHDTSRSHLCVRRLFFALRLRLPHHTSFVPALPFLTRTFYHHTFVSHVSFSFSFPFPAFVFSSPPFRCTAPRLRFLTASFTSFRFTVYLVHVSFSFPFSFTFALPSFYLSHTVTPFRSRTFAHLSSFVTASRSFSRVSPGLDPFARFALRLRFALRSSRTARFTVHDLSPTRSFSLSLSLSSPVRAHRTLLHLTHVADLSRFTPLHSLSSRCLTFAVHATAGSHRFVLPLCTPRSLSSFTPRLLVRIPTTTSLHVPRLPVFTTVAPHLVWDFACLLSGLRLDTVRLVLGCGLFLSRFPLDRTLFFHFLRGSPASLRSTHLARSFVIFTSFVLHSGSFVCTFSRFSLCGLLLFFSRSFSFTVTRSFLAHCVWDPRLVACTRSSPRSFGFLLGCTLDCILHLTAVFTRFCLYSLSSHTGFSSLPFWSPLWVAVHSFSHHTFALPLICTPLSRRTHCLTSPRSHLVGFFFWFTRRFVFTTLHACGCFSLWFRFSSHVVFTSFSCTLFGSAFSFLARVALSAHSFLGSFHLGFLVFYCYSAFTPFCGLPRSARILVCVATRFGSLGSPHSASSAFPPRSDPCVWFFLALFLAFSPLPGFSPLVVHVCTSPACVHLLDSFTIGLRKRFSALVGLRSSSSLTFMNLACSTQTLCTGLRFHADLTLHVYGHLTFRTSHIVRRYLVRLYVSRYTTSRCCVRSRLRSFVHSPLCVPLHSFSHRSFLDFGSALASFVAFLRFVCCTTRLLRFSPLSFRSYRCYRSFTVTFTLHVYVFVFVSARFHCRPPRVALPLSHLRFHGTSRTRTRTSPDFTPHCFGSSSFTFTAFLVTLVFCVLFDFLRTLGYTSVGLPLDFPRSLVAFYVPSPPLPSSSFGFTSHLSFGLHTFDFGFLFLCVSRSRISGFFAVSFIPHWVDFPLSHPLVLRRFIVFSALPVSFSHSFCVRSSGYLTLILPFCVLLSRFPHSPAVYRFTSSLPAFTHSFPRSASRSAFRTPSRTRYSHSFLSFSLRLLRSVHVFVSRTLDLLVRSRTHVPAFRTALPRPRFCMHVFTFHTIFTFSAFCISSCVCSPHTFCISRLFYRFLLISFSRLFHIHRSFIFIRCTLHVLVFYISRYIRFAFDHTVH